MLKTFLIDDESYCTDVLRVMLEKYCPDTQVCGIFNDAESALAAIKTQAPDLIFLDIEMPILNGFDLMRQCMPADFKLIFTTAYDQYAVKAFKFNALDYLLKPIDREELVLAVEKTKQSPIPQAAQLEAALYLQTNPTPDRIALPVGADLLFVETVDILFCESDGSYVAFHLNAQSKPIVVSKSLREVEELLNNPMFFRVHNSFLVNLKHIVKIVRTDGGEIVMGNKRSLPISRTKKGMLMQVIAKL